MRTYEASGHVASARRAPECGGWRRRCRPKQQGRRTGSCALFKAAIHLRPSGAIVGVTRGIAPCQTIAAIAVALGGRRRPVWGGLFGFVGRSPQNPAPIADKPTSAPSLAAAATQKAEASRARSACLRAGQDAPETPPTRSSALLRLMNLLLYQTQRAAEWRGARSGLLTAKFR